MSRDASRARPPDTAVAQTRGIVVRLLRGHGELWADQREIEHAVHGTVVGAAVMAAASLHGTVGEVTVSVITTLVVYWLAEHYAEMLAAGVTGFAPTWAGMFHSLRRGWPMVESSFVPLIVMVVITVLSSNLRLGVLVALALSTTALGGLGYLSSRRGGATRSAALGGAAGAALLGLVVMVLKLLLH
jgi:hypothetical protein